MSQPGLAKSLRFLRTERGFWTVFWSLCVLALAAVVGVPAIAAIGLLLTFAAFLAHLLSFKVVGRPSRRNAEDLYTALIGLPGALLAAAAFFFAGYSPNAAEASFALLVGVPICAGFALVAVYVLLISVVNRVS
jgi:hypothetical protein